MEDILNLSRQAYSNYERCERTPDLDNLVRLSQFYNISIDDLVLRDLSTCSPEDIRACGPSSFDGLKEASASYYAYAECRENGNSIYLTQEELDLVSSFRSQTDDIQRLITGFLRNNSSAE